MADDADDTEDSEVIDTTEALILSLEMLMNEIMEAYPKGTPGPPGDIKRAMMNAAAVLAIAKLEKHGIHAMLVRAIEESDKH